MIFTIAARELRTAFLSPIAWLLIGVIQLILGFMTGFNFQTYIEQVQPQQHLYKTALGITDFVVVPQNGVLAFLMIFTIPLISMRVFSMERKNKTLTLLFSAPISMTEIVIGKYLGLLAIVLVMLAVVTIFPLSFLFFGTLDFGLFFSSLLGITLLSATCAAIGLYFSSLTDNPIISAILTFFTIILLWFMSVMRGDSAEGFSLADLSLSTHLEAFQRGLFSSHDFIYYLLFIAAFLTLTVKRLDSDRLQH